MIEFLKTIRVPKIWGEEIIIDNTSEYCGKILCFNKGTRLSDHFHKNKNETFYCLLGNIIFRYYDLEKGERLEKTINKGDVIRIPSGNPHQIEALEYSQIIEVSSHHEDSDSFRISKSLNLNEK